MWYKLETAFCSAKLPFQWIAAKVSNLKIFAHFYGVWDDSQLWNKYNSQRRQIILNVLKHSKKVSN